jgi:glutamate decarboxylase
MSTSARPAAGDVALFGNRFVTQEVPSRGFPGTGIPAHDALRLVAENLALEAIRPRNLATFVTGRPSKARHAGPERSGTLLGSGDA